MTIVIAERRLTAVRPAAKPVLVTVQVGCPARAASPAEGDWYCSIRIKGFGRTRTQSFFGVDQLQALQFALGILEREVQAFVGNAQITWLGQSDLGLKPWMPDGLSRKDGAPAP